MPEDKVSTREFDRWADLLIQAQADLSSELKDISHEIKVTNGLLREDIATTRNLVENHIQSYRSDQRQNQVTFVQFNSRIEEIEQLQADQSSIYQSAKIIKYAATLILAGALTAVGTGLTGYVHFGKSEPIKQLKTKEEQDNTE